jgi:hypothetical protein
MTTRLRLGVAINVTCLAAFTASCGAGTSTQAPADARADTEPSPQSKRTDLPFDSLTISVHLRVGRVVSGHTLHSRLVVENRSRKTIVDPSCAIGTGRYALVPVEQPHAELWVQPVADCGGLHTMQPGYRDVSSGPSFPARTKYGKALRPGDYLAVLAIDGLSERLAYPVTVE